MTTTTLEQGWRDGWGGSGSRCDAAVHYHLECKNTKGSQFCDFFIFIFIFILFL